MIEFRAVRGSFFEVEPLAQIERSFRETADGAPGSLLIVGSPWSGKSTLLDRAIAGPLSNATVVTRDMLLAGSALDPNGSEQKQHRSDNGPILVAIDDAHTLTDQEVEATRSLLALDDRPCCAFLTSRPIEGVSEESDAYRFLVEFGAQDETITLRLKPWAAREARQRLEHDLGHAPDDAVLDKVLTRTAGNPWLIDALATAAITPTPRQDAALLDCVPDEVTQRVLLLQAGSDKLRRRLSHSLAAVGRADIGALADLTEHDLEEVAAELAELLRGGLLDCDGDEFKFAAPLLREIALADTPATYRPRLQQRIVDQAHRHGRSASDLAELILSCPPSGDPQNVSALLAAAERAGSQVRRQYLLRALDEPPTDASREEVVLALGEAELDLRDHVEEGRQRLRGLLADLATSDETRLPAMRSLVASFLADRDAAAAAQLLATQRRELENSRPELVPHIDQQWLALSPEQPAVFEQALRLAYGDAQLPEMSDSENQALELMKLEIRAMAGEHTASEAVEITTRKIGLLRRDEIPADHMCASMWLLLRADAYADLARLAERRCSADHHLSSVVTALGGLAEIRVGDLGTAVEKLDAAFEQAQEDGSNEGIDAALAFRCQAHLELLDFTAAGSDINAATTTLSGSKPSLWGVMMLLMRARSLHAREPGCEDAVSDALHAGRLFAKAPTSNPSGIHWASTAAPILTAAGRRDEAFRYADEELTLVRKWGAPIATAIALRGVAATLPEDSLDRLGRLEEALEIVEPTPARLESAHVAAALADAEARQEHDKTQTRQRYRDAINHAAAAGAIGLKANIESSLRATGARVPDRPGSGPHSLTTRELDVAHKEARRGTGDTHESLGAELGINHETYKTHRKSVHVKLGVKTPAEIAHALGEAGLLGPE